MTIADDVAVLLGRALTTDEAGRVDRLIELAETAIESQLTGFSFTAGNETVEIEWHDPDVVWTPRYPVSAVDALTIDGVTVDPTAYRWDVKGKIELVDVGSGLVINRAAVAGWSRLAVDYEFGDVPDDLAAIIAAAVAGVVRRQAANSGNVAAESLGAYSVTYDRAEIAAAAAGLILPDLPRRWKRTVAASVPLMRFR